MNPLVGIVDNHDKDVLSGKGTTAMFHKEL